MVTTIFKVLEHAFTPEECSSIINLCKNKLYKMITMGEDNGIRIASGTWLNYSDEIPEIKKLCEYISVGGNKPIENQEGVNIIRYLPGEKYDEHFDFFDEKEPYYAEEISRGGQRIQSWILYLNDDFVGGETEFPKENVHIKPATGTLVGWNNTLKHKELNLNSLHKSHTVNSGEKWVAVVWVRENKYK